MAGNSPSPSDISQLRSRIDGQVVTPADADYDGAREIYNAMHDRRPAAVVRPTGPQDVAMVIKYARSAKVVLSIRGGGHSVVGFSNCDGGIVLDLRSVAAVEVDTKRRVAKVGGGSPATFPALLEYGAAVPTIESGIFLHSIDGACHDIPTDGTPFPHRDAQFLIGIYGVWPNPTDDETNTAWVRDCYGALQPHCLRSEYVNFATEDAPGGVRSIYGANYDRLVDVKRRYDPDNLFRLNQNIKTGAV